MNARQVKCAPFLLLLCAGIAASAQRPPDVVKWSAKIDKATKTTASVTLSATIADGWHVYALSQKSGGPIPLKVSVPAGSPFTLKDEAEAENPIHHFDPNFNMETVYYQKSAKLDVTLQGNASAPPASLPVDVRFQSCNDRLCLPPYTAHLTATGKGD